MNKFELNAVVRAAKRAVGTISTSSQEFHFYRFASGLGAEDIWDAVERVPTCICAQLAAVIDAPLQ